MSARNEGNAPSNQRFSGQQRSLTSGAEVMFLNGFHATCPLGASKFIQRIIDEGDTWDWLLVNGN
jgi:hypothetical protein